MVDSRLAGQIICKNYKLVKKLGSGAFGDIYLSVNKQNGQEYALKLERSDTKYPQIPFESKLYKYLNDDNCNQEKCIPRVYFVGSDNCYNVMVMDLLGSSLEDIFNKQNRKFSLKTTLMLADQLIQRIEFLHSKFFLHRDIKPDNFLMGVQRRSFYVYMIDFGLAKRYIQKDGKHIPYKENKSLTGTARYASINAHVGIEQSRRDDLESLGYVLVYFLKGKLPWQNLKLNNKHDKSHKIMEKKMQTSIDSLCKGLPSEFSVYLNYCRNLKFEERPNYQYLRQQFSNAMKTAKFEYDYIYDWTTLPPSQSTSRNANANIGGTLPPPIVGNQSQQFPNNNTNAFNGFNGFNIQNNSSMTNNFNCNAYNNNLQNQNNFPGYICCNNNANSYNNCQNHNFNNNCQNNPYNYSYSNLNNNINNSSDVKYNNVNNNNNIYTIYEMNQNTTSNSKDQVSNQFWNGNQIPTITFNAVGKNNDLNNNKQGERLNQTKQRTQIASKSKEELEISNKPIINSKIGVQSPLFHKNKYIEDENKAELSKQTAATSNQIEKNSLPQTMNNLPIDDLTIQLVKANTQQQILQYDQPTQNTNTKNSSNLNISGDKNIYSNEKLQGKVLPKKQYHKQSVSQIVFQNNESNINSYCQYMYQQNALQFNQSQQQKIPLNKAIRN